MKNKKPISRAFIVFSLFCALLYIAFFPNRIVTESSVQIKDTIHVPAPVAELTDPFAMPETLQTPAVPIARTQSAAFPFLLESEDSGLFGFIGENNNILYQAQKDFGITYSKEGFITYPSVPDELIRKDIYGTNPLSISGPGYPLFGADGERLFIITSDCTSLREVNKQGVTLWRRSVPSWITSFSANKDHVLLGLSNGQFMLAGKTGETISGGRINDSRILCIYGTAIHKDGKLFAILSGSDPLFLVLFDIENSSEVFRMKINDPARTERRMLFSSDSRFLFFEMEEAIACFDLETRTYKSINLPGQLLDIYYHTGQQLLHLLCKNGDMKELLIIHPPDSVVFRTKFSSATRFLGSDGNLIYTGRNLDIISYTVEEE